MIPACGPPRSLSPLTVTIPGPWANACRMVGVPGMPACAKSKTAPEPRSSITGIRSLSPRAARSAAVTSSVNPVMRKLDRCTFRSSAVAGPVALS